MRATARAAKYIKRARGCRRARARPNPEPNPQGVELGGYQMLVRGEPMRARFRNGFERPEAMQPGNPTKIEFVLPDTAHTFKKGHRVMVQIQSTWFPLVDRNPQRFVPNINEARDSDFQRATQRVYRTGRMPSRVRLTTVPWACGRNRLTAEAQRSRRGTEKKSI